MSSKNIRIFMDVPLSQAQSLTLEKTQSHYLSNVMRLTEGDTFKIFNGVHGEWLVKVVNPSKKAFEIEVLECIRPQIQEPYKALLFPPIRQNRMDFMIEKATELGVTDFYPILTDNTNVTKINPDRLRKIIIEAVEQSERLVVPEIHPLAPLRETLNSWDVSKAIYVGAERQDVQSLSTADPVPASLVGPEGGFSPKEFAFFQKFDFVKPVSLGPNILRAETAAIVMVGRFLG